MKSTNATTISKPKNLTKLPMPPGVHVNELEDINTPSPPRSTSPIGKQTKTALNKPATSGVTNKRGGLLTLPMPPMVPGSEDLSGEDDYISSPTTGHSSSFKQNNSVLHG